MTTTPLPPGPPQLEGDELDFSITTSGGKYTARFLKDGTWEVHRYNNPWLPYDHLINMPGSKAWYSFLYDIHALRTGQGEAVSEMPIVMAQRVIQAAKLPKDVDGKRILPVNVEQVIALISRALVEDRLRGPFSADTLIAPIIKDVDIFDPNLLQNPATRTKVTNMLLSAVRSAQARGARCSAHPAATEGDYAEAVGAAVEAFMSTLKDKGLVP